MMSFNAYWHGETMAQLAQAHLTGESEPSKGDLIIEISGTSATPGVGASASRLWSQVIEMMMGDGKQSRDVYVTKYVKASSVPPVRTPVPEQVVPRYTESKQVIGQVKRWQANNLAGSTERKQGMWVGHRDHR